ncbi:transporter [Jatrophihabitans sp.]|uniref:PH-like domain-containing protein n=1 Tax=Jatrophihabitans sp. TaxID=1932789 RepID=UPI0030C7485B|nr:hypothetical protein [Jatrophihabitans sp.]
MTRAVLVVLCLVLLGLALLGMRRGWRNRMARQSVLAPLPGVPAELGEELLRAEGLYVGTSFASSWQDRVVHDGLGLRAAAAAALYPAGLLVERDGAEPIFVPSSTWIAARLAPGLTGKVMGDGGLLVLRWRLGEAELDTAFRADDKTTYPALVAAINERVTTP